MRNWKFISLLLLSLVAVGCHKDDEPKPDELDPETKETYYFVNWFAANTFHTYYLWNKEIEDYINTWELYKNPIEQVKEARYKDPVTKKEVDKWSLLSDDAASLYEQTSGNFGKTYGYDFILMYYDSAKDRICPVVTVVYPGSPAEKAGIKRGDAILEVNNKKLTPDNYKDIVINEMMYSNSCKLNIHSKGDINLTPIAMYEEPVLMYKTFDCGGKKVGYLNYLSFTAESCLKLIEACKYFKGEGVTELILDLRYNSGGMVITENALMSMLAPESNVIAGDVFEKEIYNEILTNAWGPGESKFETSYKFSYGGKDYEFDTSDANIGISKVYALVTSDTASASEATLSCLMPFIDVEIIGRQTSGKYCAGFLIDGIDWFNTVKDHFEESFQKGDKYLKNWAIYVMYSRYADKNGTTPCMPDGLVPDVDCSDNPRDGYQFGDPQETMLAAALERAGYSTAPKSKASSAFEVSDSMKMERLPEQIQKPQLYVKFGL